LALSHLYTTPNHHVRCTLDHSSTMAPTLSRKDSLDYISEEKTPFVRERSSSQDSMMSAQSSQNGPQESQLVTRLINAAYIGLNTLSTVAIVFLNKMYVHTQRLNDAA